MRAPHPRLPQPAAPSFFALVLLAGVLRAGCGVGADSSGTPQHVHEGNLRELLSEAEWSVLVGTPDAEFALVRPIISDFPGTSPSRGRQKRQIQNGGRLLVSASTLGRHFHLQLSRVESILDPQFVLLRRSDNYSEPVDFSLVEQESQCLYRATGARGEVAAVHLCGDHSGVRGVIVDGGPRYYQLQPLPARLRTPSNATHVLLRRNGETFRDKTDEESSECGLRPGGDTRGSEWRNATSSRSSRVTRDLENTPLPAVHIETAVFVDRDLLEHMSHNFPGDTEREVVRFVLAMVNAVQLLYESPSLGRPVRLALKRLELLHTEPAGLRRSHDIDRFLSSFCAWQAATNPGDDSHPLHWDHALILTGLDLYVVGKGGKVSSQVVGLAPVAGMCSASSCTVNEGRHFESVFVVAHEIGHNLGMRHDGPLSDNDCDPGSFLMSPTLGSGKTTWSTCSRHYLHAFLQSAQSRCLLDGPGPQLLDHSAGGLLPGERFDADQQCMLKYGRGAVHSEAQLLEDACRDLHCRRDRFTWTSHPALDGTACGRNKWCRAGRCVPRDGPATQLTGGVVDGGWSEWSAFSDCASGCLSEDSAPGQPLPHGEPDEIRGSTGVMISTRRCNNPRPENGGKPCEGSDRRYRTCSAPQCGNVARTSIRDFADQTCGRARDVQPSLLGTGLQMASDDPMESCAVWCHMRSGGSRPRAWSFPDGTTCSPGSGSSRRSLALGLYKAHYCVGGRCEEFSCDRGSNVLFGLSSSRCGDQADSGGARRLSGSSAFLHRFRDKGRRREVTDANPGMEHASGCHSSCVSPGSGLRLVRPRGAGPCRGNCTLQLCEPDTLSCGRLRTPFELASALCAKFRARVRRLSGLGMQISAADDDRDRPCRVACQDEAVPHRFYVVNGRDGWFPFGTDCSRGRPTRAYCISGRCLEFGTDGAPLYEPDATLPLPPRDRRKRSLRTDLDLLHPVLVTASEMWKVNSDLIQINRHYKTT